MPSSIDIISFEDNPNPMPQSIDWQERWKKVYLSDGYKTVEDFIQQEIDASYKRGVGEERERIEKIIIRVPTRGWSDNKMLIERQETLAKLKSDA